MLNTKEVECVIDCDFYNTALAIGSRARRGTAARGLAGPNKRIRRMNGYTTSINPLGYEALHSGSECRSLKLYSYMAS